MYDQSILLLLVMLGLSVAVIIAEIVTVILLIAAAAKVHSAQDEAERVRCQEKLARRITAFVITSVLLVLVFVFQIFL